MRAMLSEQDMAARVVAWLQEQHWDVYQEVVVRGPRADIVAVQGRIVWVIECKAAMGLRLLEQAWSWRGVAHYVSAAIPSRSGSRFGDKIMRDYGIGLLSVGDSVSETVPPLLWRRADVDTIRTRLREEHKTYAAAGNASSSYYSPWKATCDEVRAFVARTPGCSLKDLVDGIRHHYRTAANARTSLRTWIDEGKISGVRLVRDGRHLTLERTA